MPWSILAHGISALGGIINTAMVNKNNENLTRESNAANRQMVELQNKAAAEEAEKAYQRSKPITQVANMTSAGMSRAGAINALNGGGSYTPAPVNTSQDTAPQQQVTDLSALSNMGQAILAIKQLKEQKRQFNAQLVAQKQENDANRQNAKEIAQLQADTTNRNADNRLTFDKERFEAEKPKIRAEINNIVQNTENLKKVGKGIELDNIRKSLENANYPTLAKLANTQAWQNIEYTAMKLAHENTEHMNNQEKQNLELEFYRSVMDSGINLQNAQNELQAYLANKELNTYNSPTGGFIGALVFCMDKLIPKFAALK